ncbi:MAG TPA: invasion associated locus B family protein [Ancylobacter sp.]
MFRRTISAIIATLFTAGGALAVPTNSLGVFNQWSAWSYKGSSSIRCFTYSEPVSMQPAALDHGDVLFFLKAIRNGPARTEASFKTGYNFAQGSNVVITIGDETFRMMTDGQNAWLRRLEREPELLAAMQNGSSMSVGATSARGNATSYEFSLAGVTAATAKILNQCR